MDGQGIITAVRAAHVAHGCHRFVLCNSICLYGAGTYNDAIGNNASSPCTQCPTGTITAKEGSTSAVDCSLCLSGFGGPGCTTKCGGVGTEATYGPAGRSVGTPCVSCSVSGVTTGFYFTWNMENDVFIPRVVSRPSASSPVDCLSEYSQLKDGAWFIPLASDVGTNITGNVTSFADCVTLCSADNAYQLVTYDYREKTCLVRASVEGSLARYDLHIAQLVTPYYIACKGSHL